MKYIKELLAELESSQAQETPTPALRVLYWDQHIQTMMLAHACSQPC